MSAYERIAQLDPFDAANHSALGRLKMQAGDARTAVREFRAAIAAGSLDPAGAHSDLAESYLAIGRQGAGAARGARGHRSGARLSARAGAAAEGGRAMIRLRGLRFGESALHARAVDRRGARRARPAADERYALIVSGVSGTEKFAESQKTWVSSLQSTLQKRLGFAADRVIVLSEGGSGTTIANRDNVMRTLAVAQVEA